MPIYEYECGACEHRFERLVSMSAPAPACPSCDAENVRKRISQSGFILKGGGWYKDGYGASKSASDTSSSSSSTSSANDE